MNLQQKNKYLTKKSRSTSLYAVVFLLKMLIFVKNLLTMFITRSFIFNNYTIILHY